VGWPANDPGQTLYEGVDVELVHEPVRVPGAREAGVAPADAPAFLRRALAAAVDKGLAGVRRCAVLTGGGLDSSVLMGLASDWAKRTGGSAFAVCLDFAGPGDDRPHMAALERHLACDVLRVKPEDAAPRLALLDSGADAAPAASSTMPMEIEMLVRARAHGAERVLGGAGGDELFGGVPSALAELAGRGHPVRAMRAARRLQGFTRPASPSLSWVLRPILGRWLPPSLRAWRGRRHAQLPALPWGGPVVRAYLAERRRLAGEANRARPRDARERLMAIWDASQQVVIAAGRQVEEHVSGVDCWYPYVDPALMAAVASLDPELLLHGDRWRGLLRASASDLLPRLLRERMDKAHFEPAMQRFVASAGGLEELRPLASGRELAALGLVEPRPFATAFDAFVADPSDGHAWVSLWSALAVEAFLRARRS
jgi:asparagine synthase (glutamine-hydrolysing)